MLMENPDDAFGSLVLTKSKSEDSYVISTQLECSTAASTMLLQKSPSRVEDIRESKSVDSVLFIEQRKEPCTRDEPAGLSLGEKIDVNVVITEPAVTSTMLIEPTIKDREPNSTVRIIADQPAPLLSMASIEPDINQDIDESGAKYS